MEEQELVDILAQVLAQDFSAGTERFRDDLLARCLAEMEDDDGGSRSGEGGSPGGDGAVLSGGDLDDADLEMLSAAGDTTARVVGVGDEGPAHELIAR